MLTYNPIINSIVYKNVIIDILRLDLIHPEISGNKWFKLKYNLELAKKQSKIGVITFGGAFSNHIAATAFACKETGLNSIGIIRGEENSETNTTLTAAKNNGMELLFVDKNEYKQKTDPDYLQRLQYMYPNYNIIPEGGDNKLGQKGCEEILEPINFIYNSIFCAYGTGTTFKGVANSLKENQTLIAVNVLKYIAETKLTHTQILNEYHFGGYAKHTQELLNFKLFFESNYEIPLDYIYTTKLCYAIFDFIDKKKLTKKDSILMIHSGGLQGNIGYEERYNLNPNRQVIEPLG